MHDASVVHGSSHVLYIGFYLAFLALGPYTEKILKLLIL